MKLAVATFCAAAALLSPAILSAQTQVRMVGAVTEHSGPCDASAAVAVPHGGFELFIVANDETDELHAATSGADAPRLKGEDFEDYLRRDGEKEADLEGAAWLGDRIYWIGSHGRSSKGDVRPQRAQLFATTVRQAAGQILFEPVPTKDGLPYRGLLDALARRMPEIAAAIDAKDEIVPKSDRAPEKKGLNIEGLAAGKDGSLLIGLRNPQTAGGHAILVPFRNPAAALMGAPPELDEPILLDLGGRGIRSIDYAPDPAPGAYFIVAGRADSTLDFELFRWSGERRDTAPVPLNAKAIIAGIPDFRPEALAVAGDGKRIRLFSDDGDRPLSDVPNCKDRRPRRTQVFRSIVLELQ